MEPSLTPEPVTVCPLSTERLLTRAWETRQEMFPPRIEAVYPRATLPVSITGKNCHLNCAHCGGKHLNSMVSLDRALAQEETPRSYLLSGGSNSRGLVPHPWCQEEIAELSRRAPLNMHPGLVREKDARGLGKLARVFSFDLIVEEATVKEVYGSSLSAGHFKEAYRYLRRYGRVVPHLCIGLRGGHISGEYLALEWLEKEGAEAIIFLVFRPTPGTAYARRNPPAPGEVAQLLATARLRFPRTPLYLGCMRPGGKYRRALDPLALRAGINRVVQPARELLKEAQKKGLELEEREECCAL